MNSTVDDYLIQSLKFTSEQLNRYLSPIIFIFGVVGNILNCLVLSQRTLRSNPCALLFLVSSLIDLISILIGLPTRILAGWKLDYHLFRILLVQILLLIFLCIPQVIQKFHLTFRPFRTISKLDDAIRTFLYNITLLLAFIASGMPFYIYTLTGGTVFRKTFLGLMRNAISRMR